ncbi:MULTISPECIES: hypothetical protein [Desulfosediminicola]|uniref:hypothetical protein n=1 Tax=Desulfosediminicola TaxID=2886823 RepID=UPI0010AD2074|nr:hypothetical protein [Desulfosediminicola ganghwensis]
MRGNVRGDHGLSFSSGNVLFSLSRFYILCRRNHRTTFIVDEMETGSISSNLMTVSCQDFAVQPLGLAALNLLACRVCAVSVTWLKTIFSPAGFIGKGEVQSSELVEKVIVT